MRLRRTPIPFHGFLSTSSATMAAACFLAPQPSSASTPKVAKHQHPDATLRTSARKSECHILLTISSTRRNRPPFTFRRVDPDSWCHESHEVRVEHCKVLFNAAIRN